jgi:hypothetical protein
MAKKTEIKKDLSNLVKKLTEEKRTVPIQKVVPVEIKDEQDEDKVKYIPFAFTLEKELVLFIKELVLFRIKESLDNYFYNESEAIREGIELMKLAFPMEKRPVEISNPTKSGRGASLDKSIERVNTSFLLHEEHKEYIYDFIYHKQEGGGRFTKGEFITLVVEQLKRKYKF